MIKNLQSLTLAFVLMITSLVALAANDHIKVIDHGAYFLGVDYHDDKGNEYVGSLTAPHSIVIHPQHNSKMFLYAQAGRSTVLTSKDYGTIKCTGTTIIGFKCKYQ